MRIGFLIVILSISLDLFAQQVDSTQLIIDPVELMPEFPGGMMGKKVKVIYTLQIKIPYVDLKCERLSTYSTLCWDAATLADFNSGNGKSKDERVANFICNKLQWPSQDDCSGKVYVQCIVECDGKLSNLNVVRKLCPDFDNEALRVVRLMPNWTPAIKSGKPVRSMITIPIKFVLK